MRASLRQWWKIGELWVLWRGRFAVVVPAAPVMVGNVTQPK